jgi:hypothetical protein
VPPASAFEFPQREIVNLIGNSHQVPTDQDLNQMTRAVRDGKLIYCVDSGPLNTVQVVNLSPLIMAYTQGLTLHVLIGHTVTGPTTIAIGNLNPTAIKRRDGAELQANDMVAGQIATLVSDGTFFQLQNMGADGTTGGATTLHNVDIPYVHDTGALDPNWANANQVIKNHLIGLFSPVLPDIREGRTVEVKLDQIIKGPTDFAPNNFPIHPVAHPDGTPIQDGDGVPNQIWLLVFDSVQWQLLDVFNSGPSATVPSAPAVYDGRSLQLMPPHTPYFVSPGTPQCLYRYPSVNSNRQVFTISMFLKQPATRIGDGNNIITTGDAGGTWWGCEMVWFALPMGQDVNGHAQVYIFWNNSGGQIAGPGTYESYTGTDVGQWDPNPLNNGSWHHLLMASDGATASVWIDGIVRTRGSIAIAPGGLNSSWNSTRLHLIGSQYVCANPGGIYGASSLRYAEIIHLDGTFIGDWTKFATVNNGIPIPINPGEVAKFNFGTNGFYLNWSNAVDVTPTGLGKDISGQNNNWTPMNMDLSHVQTDFPGKQQS